MPLLYYWKPANHRRDLDLGAGYHLNQGSPLLHGIPEGDSVWAFTSREVRGVRRYVLAAQLVVAAKTRNPPGFRYGPYRVWGHLTQSRYFAVKGQANVEPVLRAVSGRTTAKAFGRAFQGHAAVCRIDDDGHRVLMRIAADLPPEPRARLLPEDRLEAELLLGDADSVRRLLAEERPGIDAERRRYLQTRAVVRSQEHADALLKMYDGRCQVCRWKPRDTYRQELCEGHHVHWLSRGGEDALTNMVLLCPNHHRAVHRCDAQLDWADMAFVFPASGLRERLAENTHLVTAAP